MTMDETTKNVVQLLEQGLLGTPEATAQLEALKSQPGFTTVALNIATPSATPGPISDQVRFLAAIQFKNAIKFAWTANENSPLTAAGVLQAAERAFIKEHLVTLMLSAPEGIQKSLSEAVTIISASDFPASWESLLPTLINHMSTSQNPAEIQGALATADAIFRRYRGAMPNDEIMAELKYVVTSFPAPMLALWGRISTMIDGAVNSAEALNPLLNIANLLASIFYSLNWIDLPEQFEDALPTWMDQFHKFLTIKIPVLEDPYNVSLLDKLRGSIIRSLALFMEKYDEECAPFLQTLTSDIWTLVANLDNNSKWDILVSTSLRFLTAVASSVHWRQFEDGNVRADILNRIAIPNLAFREEDQEMFEDDPRGYISADLEGGDAETRRRSAFGLISAFVENFEATTMETAGNTVNQLIGDASNWKSKDMAIFLVTALSAKTSTRTNRGVTEVRNIDSILSFCTTQVLPELVRADGEGADVLRADALKFLAVFRHHLPVEIAVGVVKSLPPLITSESFVVSSYAAHVLEVLLRVKKPTGRLIELSQVADSVDSVMAALFTSMMAPKNEHAQENEHVMKAVMRLSSFAGPQISAKIPEYFAHLTQILERICTNPRQPNFNHYVFETIGAYIGTLSSTNTALLSTFESALFPPFQQILQQDVAEFTPYVFQLLAQLLELTPPPLTPAYTAILNPITQAANWERNANVPGLSRLLVGYILKSPELITSNQLLAPIMGIFQRLASQKIHEIASFELLNALIETFPLEAIDGPQKNRVVGVMTILIQKLHDQKSRTTLYPRYFVNNLFLWCAKYGSVPIFQALEALGQNLGAQIVAAFATKIPLAFTVASQRKTATVGLTRILTEQNQLTSNPQNAQIWANALETLMALFSGAVDSSTGEEKSSIAASIRKAGSQSKAAKAAQQNPAAVNEFEESDVKGPEGNGYTIAYSGLSMAKKLDRDLFPDIANPAQMFAQSLNTLVSSGAPAVNPALVSAPARQGLSQCFQGAGIQAPF